MQQHQINSFKIEVVKEAEVGILDKFRLGEQYLNKNL